LLDPTARNIARRSRAVAWLSWCRERRDALLATFFGLASLALYAATAAPSVWNMFDDNLEWQVVIPTLGISHPTGYPLFTLLGKLFVTIVPWRDPAGRANLFSAAAAAAAVAIFYLLAHEFSGDRAAAGVATVAFALAPTWWTLSTQADVHPAHGLVVALFLYLLLRWDTRRRSGDAPPARSASESASASHTLNTGGSPSRAGGAKQGDPNAGPSTSAGAAWPPPPPVGRAAPPEPPKGSRRPQPDAAEGPASTGRGPAGSLGRSSHSFSDAGLAGVGLVAGIGLVHHRMFVLLLPAALLFILWTDPSLAWQPRRWLKPLLLMVAPLPLYLYLPLRGQAVTSLDGTFRPTLAGTLGWIMARQYDVFLSGNPFNLQRDTAFFVGQFRDQLGTVLLLAALLGMLTAWRRSPRRYTLLLVATACQAAFDLVYKVQNIGSFLLPAYLLAAVWAAAGVACVLGWLRSLCLRLPERGGAAGTGRPWIATAATGAVVVLLLVEPALGGLRAYPHQDLSHAWGLFDYGQDMLQNVAPNGEIVGLLGETTLVRYFRDVLGQRPDVQVVAADAESDRLAAVAAALQRGQAVYLTRDLPGAAGRYSLRAAGPLIAVGYKAQPAPQPAGNPIGAGIALVDSRMALRSTHGGPVLRLTLTWAAAAPTSDSLKVSARLLDAQGAPLAQTDQVPVHFTYPTTDWVPGERVQDVYDLPLPGTYEPESPADLANAARPPVGPTKDMQTLPQGAQVLLILYRATDGTEEGRLTLPASAAG